MSFEISIRHKIEQTFAPSHLEVENESHTHNVPKGSETHFRVLVVSEKFAGLNRVQRQRMIYDLLADELKNGVHALALRVYTPEEWKPLADQVDLTSPLCHSKTKKPV